MKLGTTGDTKGNSEITFARGHLNGNTGDPNFHQKSTNRLLSTNNNSSGRALEPPEEFLPHSGMKNLRITTQEDKSDNFLQPTSSHSPSWHCSMPRGTFSARRSPLARKGKVRTGTSFSSLLRYRTKVLFLVSPQTD